ncbi:glycerol-3-phosphate dehydrogenase/oxidase [Pelagicoccus sp. SDUM812005]|uniref:glycerol-3-phosphate dehydrogenase/oxidase n=1 Tax=Pelagicoccus sp. SDUM812005 TaxID=3041257 RepID=UPI00281024BB|nr:glycerol-3-phosphate dehydrogenase/oxidase [Pelagicoccus sp. SDUM812005]MDQ8179639.1 glycerol-3-phosphate dehydrogenase/oxidase [Pelagicoccus sp. SDUM812005]
MNRENALSTLRSQNEPFDILIVGGGATGLGTAVDAATRGHTVALIEQADFAKGTSSRSTKLVHGGVRYLRQGNVSLVLEALRERGYLYRNAPHLVHDQAFVIPNYHWWEGPFYGVGMKVYDALAGKLGLASSKTLSLAQTIERIPTIETQGLTGGVVYHDGQFDDSRLAINLAQSAAKHGAVVANYTQCIQLLKTKDNLVRGALVEDQETGERFEILANAVVNATGVFADTLRQQDDPNAAPIISASQGIHIVLPKKFLPNDAAIMVPKTEDGRVLFAVPWHDRVVVGTTDTPRDGNSLEPRALQSERDFIMEHAAKYLAHDPQPEDVLSIYAGLRPLVKSGDSSNTAALSRDHTILISDSGLLTVTGGKWTTYRKMAEDVVDHLEILSGIEELPCSTKQLPIYGATQDAIAEANLAPYGSASQAIRKLIREQPNSSALLHPKLPYQEAEVLYHARTEMARSVEDVLSRRTRALLLDARAAIEAAPRVAALLATELGREATWAAQQVESFTRLAQGYDFLHPDSVGQS